MIIINKSKIATISFINFGNAKQNKASEISINLKKINNSFEKCYYSPENSHLKIIHLILTRFLVEFSRKDTFIKNIYNDSYILNGIRVLKKYLLPSLENQSCKQFIWTLLLGDKINITYIKQLIIYNSSFELNVIYNKDLKYYVKNKTKDFDILISTRIDYDDRIYYDAVNDVRKVININKPMFLYGYNRGVMYFESEDKYYYYYFVSVNNKGVLGIFASLITVLNKVNDTYTIMDLGSHSKIRMKILESYKSFGIKDLKYEPAIFESGEIKYVYVRHKYSKDYKRSIKIKNKLIQCNFNLTKFYGK